MPETIFSPTHLPDPESSLFKTASINFAAAVIAADILEYVRTEVKPNGVDGWFVLEDPNKLAGKLQDQFNRGVFRNVNPKLLFDCRSFLADEANKARGVTRAKS
jgi:hypothetical protein